MAKIAIDARRLRTTTGRYVRELLNELQNIDTEHEFHVIIHELDQGSWAPTADNIFMHVVKWDHYTFGEQLGFALFLYNLKPDLVHFTMPQQPLLYIGKRVTTVHDLTLVRFKNLDKNRLLYAIDQTIFKFLLKNISRRSLRLITPSKYVAEDLAEYTGVERSKIIVTHEAGIADTQIKPEPVEAFRGADYLFYVGNAFPHKNLKRLIDAHQLLLDKYPGLQLVIAGKKDFFHEQLEAYVDEVGAKQVVQLGFIPDEQMVWLFKHAQAYVFPSLSEGFGLPGLEAMQFGAPVVSSNATCLPEVYRDAAHYFDPLSPEDMARAIDEVMRSKQRRADLEKAAKDVIDSYSWAKMARGTFKIYNTSIDV